IGTALLPVAGSGDCPACSASVSKPGYLGLLRRLVQVLARRARVGLEGALGLLLLRAALLPVAVEQLVHQRGGLGHLVLLELARQDRGHVLDHAAALRLVDRLRRRADEEEPRFLLAVLVVHGDVDLDRLVAQRPEVLERRVERAVEAAADLAGPADVEDCLLYTSDAADE